jgi:predicted phage gp36 major capsid-like protein
MLLIMTVLNFRTDQRSEKALAELMADGSTASEAIRQALVDAVRLRRREQMRAESRELMNDEVDLAESRSVAAAMDAHRAW